MGFEWLYRLVADPQRLFHRYCIEPWGLMGAVVHDIKIAIGEKRLFRGPRSQTQKTPSATAQVVATDG